jgi:hypothetical protein
MILLLTIALSQKFMKPKFGIIHILRLRVYLLKSLELHFLLEEQFKVIFTLNCPKLWVIHHTELSLELQVIRALPQSEDHCIHLHLKLQKLFSASMHNKEGSHIRTFFLQDQLEV